MGHGAHAAYSAPIASFSTSSAEVDLGRSWQINYLVVPSMTSQSQVHLQASDISGGIFRRVTMPIYNSTAAAAPTLFTVVSGVTGQIVPMPNGLRYVKVETTAIVSFTANFRIICSD